MSTSRYKDMIYSIISNMAIYIVMFWVSLVISGCSAHNSKNTGLYDIYSSPNNYYMKNNEAIVIPSDIRANTYYPHYFLIEQSDEVLHPVPSLIPPDSLLDK